MHSGQVGGELSGFAAALTTWAATALPNLFLALLLLVAGWALAGWAERGIRRVLDRAGVDETLRGVAAAVMRYAVLIVVIIAALGQLGVQTTSMLAALGAIGLAIALALQGTLANIAAGIMLLWLRPFRVGDQVEVGTVSGTVKEVGLFASQLHSWDGVYQFVPNSELWNKRIINYSRLERRLVAVRFGIAYADDTARARDILLAQAMGEERVLQQPTPECVVEELGVNYVFLGLRAWTATADYWPVRRSLTEQGKKALEAAGLTVRGG
jgi:small conductance mechanosensitive channel